MILASNDLKKRPVFLLIVFLWLRVVDDVRTAVADYQGYISIPTVKSQIL